MGFNDSKSLGSVCGFAKSKFDEMIEQKRKKRSHSESAGAAPRKGTGKLHKPPQVRIVSGKPRNRLRKQPIPLSPESHVCQAMKDLFVLEYEPYPVSSEPGKVLGVYSTFDSVTLGAFAHGAYTFSRDGLLDGNEYLSPTGHIKLVRTTVQRTGVRALIPAREDSLQDEHVRLDIPHPESQPHDSSQLARADEKHTARDTVFLAVRAGPRTASWIGVFADKSLAWGACLKDKAMCAVSAPLCDEVSAVGDNNLPQTSGRLVGSGRCLWKVEEHAIDDSRQVPKGTVRDV